MNLKADDVIFTSPKYFLIFQSEKQLERKSCFFDSIKENYQYRINALRFFRQVATKHPIPLGRQYRNQSKYFRLPSNEVLSLSNKLCLVQLLSYVLTSLTY